MPSSRAVSVLGLLLCAAAVTVGCASPPPEPARTPAPPPAAAPAAAAPKRAVPAGHLRREDVLAVLSEGPGAFLGKLDVEPVLDRESKFRGWRVVEIRDGALAGEHLAVGDVVTAVNDRRIEREGEFYEVFQSLAFAKELRLQATRAGAARAVVLPIDDDPNAPPVPLAEPTVAPKKSAKKR